MSVPPAEVMEKGLNTELYWKNDDPTHTVSMVPTSAITGEGIPDLLLWLVRLTQVCCELLFSIFLFFCFFRDVCSFFFLVSAVLCACRWTEFTDHTRTLRSHLGSVTNRISGALALLYNPPRYYFSWVLPLPAWALVLLQVGDML